MTVLTEYSLYCTAEEAQFTVSQVMDSPPNSRTQSLHYSFAWKGKQAQRKLHRTEEGKVLKMLNQGRQQGKRVKNTASEPESGGF